MNMVCVCDVWFLCMSVYLYIACAWCGKCVVCGLHVRLCVCVCDVRGV